jgi:Ran GTPase-activating protein (RanGAP) involved in mRNA processing and transport
VLRAQCPALAHLNLRGNSFGPEGAGRLAGVMAQCPALAHLNLSKNDLGIYLTPSLSPSVSLL